jgi:hypothetical protein
MEIKECYVGQFKVRPKKWWIPWENTIAYYPFKWDMNNRAGTWTATWWTIGADYLTCNANTITVPFTETNSSNSPFTANIWIKITRRPSYNPRIYNDRWGKTCLIVEHYYSTWVLALKRDRDAQRPAPSYTTAISGNQWTNIILTYSWSWNTFYIYNNGQKFTYPNGIDRLTSDNKIQFGSNGSDLLYAQISEFIFEKVQRTDDQSIEYFNQTKSDYWIQ